MQDTTLSPNWVMRQGKALQMLMQTFVPRLMTALYQHLAELLAPLINVRVGTTGSSSIGIVAGATWPEEALSLRKTLPNAPFLIPGFGAQGARPEMATRGLIRGERGWEGGLVNSTRSLIFPKNAANANTLGSWRDEIMNTINQNKAILNSAF